MIRAITNGSQHITVQGGAVMPYISPGAVSAGQLRFNPNTQNFEVYDGNTWHNIAYNAQVDLNSHTKDIIDWAGKKMQEERQLKSLIDKHPGLKDLLDKFEIMKILCQEEEKHDKMV